MDKVNFGSLRRLEPVSRRWGFDRGNPIDRYYIEAFLQAKQDAIHGHVLEIKDGYYTEKFGADRVVNSEVLDIDPQNPVATLIADITDLEGFETNLFDCIIFTQTLQFIDNPELALRSLNKLLKPNGSLLITCPGITRTEQESGDGGWYWTFTPLSLGMLLEKTFGSDSFHITSHGNVFAATCFLWGISTEEVSPSELDHQDLDYPVLLTAIATKNI